MEQLFEDVRVVFGLRIRELRTRKRLAQNDLADRAGLNRAYLGGIERGERNVSLENIVKIATALKEPLSTLFEVPGSLPEEIAGNTLRRISVSRLFDMFGTSASMRAPDQASYYAASNPPPSTELTQRVAELEQRLDRISKSGGSGDENA